MSVFNSCIGVMDLLVVWLVGMVILGLGWEFC